MKFVGLDGLSHFWTKAKTWIINRITTEVTAKIAEVVAKAPEDLDTLREIADWIKSHANDAAAMNTAISTNASDIATLKTSVSGKADTTHTHTKSQITDFPTSLPADGGTATKATQDSNGNNIANTYMPKSGGTFSGDVTFKNAIRCKNITSTEDSTSLIINTYNPGNLLKVANGMCDITFTPDDVQIDVGTDIILNTPSGTVCVNNGLTIDTDEIYIQSKYGFKRLDSYIKNVVADSSVLK